MIKFFADDLIQANIGKLAPLFHELPNDEKEDELLEELLKIAQREASQYKFDKNQFFAIVKPRIDEIVELLSSIKDKKKNLKITIALLKEYYKSKKSKDINPHFADFIDAALTPVNLEVCYRGCLTR